MKIYFQNFIKLKEEVHIKQVHTLISADLNLIDVSLQYCKVYI